VVGAELRHLRTPTSQCNTGWSIEAYPTNCVTERRLGARRETQLTNPNPCRGVAGKSGEPDITSTSDLRTMGPFGGGRV
jgi:hypothetical protein